MATIGESGSNPNSERRVVVRVKRKSSQACLDAFWLEINERPSKRALLDLQKLSINDKSAGENVEVANTRKKVFVQHIETVSDANATVDILDSLKPSLSNAVESISRNEGRKSIKRDGKQDHLLSKARRSHEISSQNARFEQIWRSRRGNKEAAQEKELHDLCQFYDVVRVDNAEGRSAEAQNQELIMPLEDQKMLSSYLPLLREFIPSAAADIESDIHGCMLKPDDYVYDYYTIREDVDMEEECSSNPFPLVQVEDEDFYDGPDEESDYETDDSNAEHHPRNEYPDEESDVEDEEEIEESSKESEEDDDKSSRSSEYEERLHGLSKDAIQSWYDGDDNFDHVEDDNIEYDDDSDDDFTDWR